MKKIYSLGLIAGFSLFIFTGCSSKPSGYNYSATSNIPGVQVYCGYKKEVLKHCYTTPFKRYSSASLGWSNKYFQGKKEGYKDTKIIKHPVTHRNASVYFYMEKIDIKAINDEKYKETVAKLIEKNDFQELKKYTDKNPQAAYYITDKSLRLMLTGPKGMKVGDVRKLINSGNSEVLVMSLIKRVKTPYKEFTLDEIKLLQEMGLSDRIIAAMIDRTTQLLDNKKLRSYQEHLLAEQKKIGNKKIEVIHKNTSNNTSNPVQDELMKQGTKMLLDQLF